MSAMQSDADRRRARRFSLDGRTPLILNADGRSFSCSLEDISIDGLRLRFQDGTPEQGRVSLEHPAVGVLEGECVWTGEGDAGVQLDDPQRDLERVLQCVSLIVNPAADGQNDD